MSFLTIAITLALVLDPFGNLPLFISILQKSDAVNRPRIILRESLIALIILFFFLFFGHYVLLALHISEPAVSISGGVILFLISLKMIFPAPLIADDEAMAADPLIVPLAVPLIAGPSSMAMLMLLSRQFPGQLIALSGALLLAWIGSTVILLFSMTLYRWMGKRIIKAIERLMGMVLTLIAIQMLLNGFKLYFKF